MAELSIIIPFCNEYPQVAFTIQSLWCDLRDRVDFEIIAIDNFHESLLKEGRVKDKGGEYLLSLQDRHPWLKVIKYEEKLSHWNAKRVGVEHCTGDFLFFIDAHCILSRDILYNMFQFYKNEFENLNGTLHLPISYMLEQPGLELIYKLIVDLDRGLCHYSFSRFRKSDAPYKVPCMSTCGMMITRSLYNYVGGWPKELGIYGGGENFINFTLAVLGKSVNIFPSLPLFHYAEKRGYSWNHHDWVRNRCIAAYLHGGEEFAFKFINNVRGYYEVLKAIYENVLSTCKEHRNLIKSRITVDLPDWVSQWT